jgi:hypothetical protein
MTGTGTPKAMDVNYDPDVDPLDLEADVIRAGEHDVAAPYGRYARLVLEGDYAPSAKR